MLTGIPGFVFGETNKNDHTVQHRSTKFYCLILSFMLFLFRNLSAQRKKRLTTRPKSVRLTIKGNLVSSHPIIIIIAQHCFLSSQKPFRPFVFFQFSSEIKRRLLHNNLMKPRVFLFISLCHWHTTQIKIKQIGWCFFLSCLNPEECWNHWFTTLYGKQSDCSRRSELRTCKVKYKGIIMSYIEKTHETHESFQQWKENLDEQCNSSKRPMEFNITPDELWVFEECLKLPKEKGREESLLF